jgi:hypothetical protein
MLQDALLWMRGVTIMPKVAMQPCLDAAGKRSFALTGYDSKLGLSEEPKRRVAAVSL